MYVTGDSSVHLKAHLHVASLPQLPGLVLEQVEVLTRPIQHFPPLPHKDAAKSESSAELSFARAPPAARAAQSEEAAEKVLREVFTEKQAPEGAAE